MVSLPLVMDQGKDNVVELTIQELRDSGIGFANPGLSLPCAVRIPQFNTIGAKISRCIIIPMRETIQILQQDVKIWRKSVTGRSIKMRWVQAFGKISPMPFGAASGPKARGFLLKSGMMIPGIADHLHEGLLLGSETFIISWRNRSFCFNFQWSVGQ